MRCGSGSNRSCHLHPPERAAIRRRVEETVGQGPGEPGMGLDLPMTKPATLVLVLAGREAMELDHDRLGTEDLLLGLAREGEGVAVRVLQDLGAGWLELREASAKLRRVIPLAQQHLLPSGDQLVLISLEIWSDWLDLRYAVVYATPEPEGEHRRSAVGMARRAAWRRLKGRHQFPECPLTAPGTRTRRCRGCGSGSRAD